MIALANDPMCGCIDKVSSITILVSPEQVELVMPRLLSLVEGSAYGFFSPIPLDGTPGVGLFQCYQADFRVFDTGIDFIGTSFGADRSWECPCFSLMFTGEEKEVLVDLFHVDFGVWKSLSVGEFVHSHYRDCWSKWETTQSDLILQNMEIDNE